MSPPANANQRHVTASQRQPTPCHRQPTPTNAILPPTNAMLTPANASQRQPTPRCRRQNVACAARVAQQKMGAKRVLIFDWDVHHGAFAALKRRSIPPNPPACHLFGCAQPSTRNVVAFCGRAADDGGRHSWV